MSLLYPIGTYTLCQTRRGFIQHLRRTCQESYLDAISYLFPGNIFLSVRHMMELTTSLIDTAGAEWQHKGLLGISLQAVSLTHVRDFPDDEFI